MSQEKIRDCMTEQELREGIGRQCRQSAGPLDSALLCASISVIDPPDAISVHESTKISEVMKLLQDNNIGCLTITDDQQLLTGIFGERDYLLKVYRKDGDQDRAVSTYMTREPVTIALDQTLAYALTLMSQGQFRHLPVVSEDGAPISMVSSKSIIDYLANRVLEDLLSS